MPGGSVRKKSKPITFCWATFWSSPKRILISLIFDRSPHLSPGRGRESHLSLRERSRAIERVRAHDTDFKRRPLPSPGRYRVRPLPEGEVGNFTSPSGRGRELSSG